MQEEDGIVSLMGKVKEELHARQHLLPCCIVTRSGIKIRHLIQSVYCGKSKDGPEMRPAFVGANGKALRSPEMNRTFIEILCYLFASDHTLFLADIKTIAAVEETYNILVLRSLCSELEVSN